MWVNQDPRYPNSFIIKTDQQKLLGLVRTDKNGETYWKFKERVRKEGLVLVKNNPETSPVMDNIQKFQQRQNQAIQPQNHEQSTNATDNNSQPTN